MCLLCFSSAYHFSNEFRKIFGMTPTSVRNCEPYTEVCKGTLNPHSLLQQVTAPFGDKEYKRSLFNRVQSKFRSHILHCFLLYTFIYNI
ncbi:AraC family transcriptional regulator [Eubacterium sp.]